MDDLSRLQGEIARLTSENAKLHDENKSHRIKRKRAQDELAVEKEQREALAKQLDDYKNVVQTSPDEWKLKYDELSGQVRTDKHKNAFTKVAKEFKVREDAIDDLWSLSKYTPEGDEPSEDAIKGHLEPIVKAKPYFLAADETVTEVAKPLPPGPGVTRPRLGEPTGAVRVVSKKDMADFKFMSLYQHEIGKGLADGSIVREE